MKAIILDWSGTAADAHVIAPAISFCRVFEKYGVPITMEEARFPMGLRLVQYFRVHFVMLHNSLAVLLVKKSYNP